MQATRAKQAVPSGRRFALAADARAARRYICAALIRALTMQALEKCKPVRVYVGVGSNIDAPREITAGLAQLAQHFGNLQISPAYRSAAVGFEGPPFINLVVGFDTALSLDAVIAGLRHIEQQRNKKKHKRFSSRRLDLDLLLYGEIFGVHQGLELPRSDITQYAHVARPLADLAGSRRHPVLKLTFAEISLRLNTPQHLEPVFLSGAPHADNDSLARHNETVVTGI